MVGELSEVENKVSDKAHQREFQRAIQNAESMADTRFDNVKVHSIATMGDAAGWFKPTTEEMAVREDVVATRENCRNLLSRVLVHEELHNKGMEMEGLTEWFAINRHREKGLNTKVIAYKEEVRAAQKIVDILGEEKTEELAMNKNAKQALTQAIAETQAQSRRGLFRVLRGGGSSQAADNTARKEAAELVKAAA